MPDIHASWSYRPRIMVFQPQVSAESVGQRRSQPMNTHSAPKGIRSPSTRTRRVGQFWTEPLKLQSNWRERPALLSKGRIDGIQEVEEELKSIVEAGSCWCPDPTHRKFGMPLPRVSKSRKSTMKMVWVAWKEVLRETRYPTAVIPFDKEHRPLTPISSLADLH